MRDPLIGRLVLIAIIPAAVQPQPPRCSLFLFSKNRAAASWKWPSHQIAPANRESPLRQTRSPAAGYRLRFRVRRRVHIELNKGEARNSPLAPSSPIVVGRFVIGSERICKIRRAGSIWSSPPSSPFECGCLRTLRRGTVSVQKPPKRSLLAVTWSVTCPMQLAVDSIEKPHAAVFRPRRPATAGTEVPVAGSSPLHPDLRFSSPFVARRAILAPDCPFRLLSNQPEIGRAS